jgi:hypothetical protein
MADVAVTAANVAPDSGTIYDQGIAGAAITAGMTLYLDSATNTYKPADSNLSAAAATVTAIAMGNAAAGQPLVIARPGSTLNPGFTVTVGAVYVQSATNAGGAIAPVADLVTGWRTTIIGIGITATQLKFICSNGGVAVP